jgi:serine/threonine protein kinase
VSDARPDVGSIGSTANTYAIIAKLATGGMAEIFLARTESAAGVERYCVLKRVLQHRATDITFVNMFLDEARLAAQLQHPNIAQVYDTGKLGDSYFFTMEYVHGETVRELMHRAYALGHTIPLGVALTIIAGAASGLQHAHERVGMDGRPLGIVHRDVSPSNLMVSYEGSVKVVDFGVAKATLRSTETQSGAVKGKIGYMAPEQCKGGVVDLRCDLFSLGIVLWEVLVGERLFRRATDYDSMEAIVIAPAPAPSTKRPDVTPSIDAICAKLLQKSPSARYQNTAELLDDLDEAAAKSGTSLSTPALRRFVRELFGQRPEPWVEMRVREAMPEVVTVTGAPLVGPITAVESVVHEQLDNVVDLSSIRALPRPATVSTVVGEAPVRERAAMSPFLSTRRKIVAADDPRAVSSQNEGVGERIAPANELDDEPVRRRARWPLVLVGLGALAVIAVAIDLAVTRSSGPAAAAPPVHAVTTPDAAAPRVAPADAAAIAVADEPKVPPPPPPAPPKPLDLGAAVRADRFADVVAACAGNSKLAIANASTCVLAACHVHDADKARRWLPRAGRGAMLAGCAKLGTPLVERVVEVRAPVPRGEPKPDPVNELPKLDPKPKDPPKPPKPKCDPTVDPMSCRQ